MTPFPHCRCQDYSQASLPYRASGPVLTIDAAGVATFCFTIALAPVGANGDVCVDKAPAHCCQLLKATLGKMMLGVSKSLSPTTLLGYDSLVHAWHQWQLMGFGA